MQLWSLYRNRPDCDIDGFEAVKVAGAKGAIFLGRGPGKPET